MGFVRQHKGAVLWSVALHVAMLAGAAIGIPWPERARVAVTAVPIQGVIIDQAAIEREQEQREQAARQERQRQQRIERERRAAAEQQRVAEQREAQRVEDARLARERAAAEKREQEQRDKQAIEQREREAREKEAAAKREREAAEARRKQQQAESELQQQLALEAEQNAAREAGLLDQYIRMIESRIKQHWDRPLSARAGLDCVVQVVQLPTGDVVSATVAACNGDDVVRRSIERAVMDASPLPKPPTPALFERSLNVNFRPDE